MNDFCIFILTHGRPNNVITYNTLKKANSTIKTFIVIDDEDKTADQYYDVFGDDVLMFSKEDISKTFDEGDNFNDRRCIIYARNACFEIAKKLGYRYFIQLDDDYTSFQYRHPSERKLLAKVVTDVDEVFYSMLKLFKSIPAKTIAIAQGGDFIGGALNDTNVIKGYKRKAMNSFMCDTERPFSFYGRINEDVNFYTNEGRKGELILSIMKVMLTQKQTQSNAGGMTDIYLDKGTYFKSFYSVMYSPSCVKISLMGNKSSSMRLHHRVSWNNCAVKILSEEVKKAQSIEE